MSHVGVLLRCSFLRAPAHVARCLRHLSTRDNWSWRTHTCGDLREEHLGRKVILAGWVQFTRLGGRFVLLRDAHGTTQLFLQHPEEILRGLGGGLTPESVLKVEGTVRERPEGQANPEMATGSVEVLVERVERLCRAPPETPVLGRDHNRVSGEALSKYRYLTLRYPDVLGRLRLRSAFVASVRSFLLGQGFVDVETPTLFRRTPGGAQEFVVPTRQPGQFYSLVQSPQQFKQLLMVGGLDRYFQVARCYRDEGARPDRQPEFTQVDIELSFTSKDRVKLLVESLLRTAWPGSLGPFPEGPIPTLTHEEALARYGSDKPDLRFENEIVDLSDTFLRARGDPFVARCLRGGEKPSARAISFLPDRGREVTPGRLRKIESDVISAVKDSASSGDGAPVVLSSFSVNERGELRSSLLRKCPESVTGEAISKLNLCEGSVGFIATGRADLVAAALGRVRAELGPLATDLGDRPFSFLWVEDFPLFEKDGEGNLASSHHPFTRPKEEDLEKLTIDPAGVKGEHYDLVLNGHEVAGGSIRIHESSLQRHVIEEVLKLDSSEFSHMLEALDYGCPPHGGIAIGLDRLLAVMLDLGGVRDVMAFPKSTSGRDAMSDAPAEISEEEQKLYHIRVISQQELLKRDGGDQAADVGE